MSEFFWLPVALLGAVTLIVACVNVAVEVVERRRTARRAKALARRRRFRPVVIQGGRTDAPVAVGEDEKLAG